MKIGLTVSLTGQRGSFLTYPGAVVASVTAVSSLRAGSMGPTENSIRYYTEDSPGHYLRTGIFLAQQRKAKDYRGCDVIFLLDDGQRDHLHSAIAGAHSAKLARLLSTSRIPLILDLTHYPARTVSLVVDWMYEGSVEMRTSELINFLVVTSALGVVFFHRQLERSLRVQAQKGPIVQALNIATYPNTGISNTTLCDFIQMIVKRHEQGNHLTLKEVRLLTFGSIVTLVKSRTKMSEKAHLINLALVWLRYHPTRIDEAIKQIFVQEMAQADLDAFRVTLVAAMKNPKQRGRTFIAKKEGTDWLTICFERDQSSDLLSRYSSNGRSRSNSSYIGTNQFVDPVKFTKWERDMKPLDYSSSEISDIGRLPNLFKDGAQEVRSFTRSEVDDIRCLPEMFNKFGEVPVKESLSSVTGSVSSTGTQTVNSMSVGTLEEAREMQEKAEKESIVSTYEKKVPSAMTSSFYAKL